MYAQRSDDRPETVERRLDVYLASIAPLVAYYDQVGRLMEVNGNREPGDVTEALIAASLEKQAV
jgi:adenylate kinase